MAFQELIKNFDGVRSYLRQFYVYGFKRREEYDQKSARSYDNERRRVESWLGEHMRFRHNAEGKQVFLSVDSRSIRQNPLYKALKAKSFTSKDVSFHFYILDLLAEGEAYTPGQITELFAERYFCHFPPEHLPELSTVRKKLKEYVALGLLREEKRGKELYYSRSSEGVNLRRWAEALAFYSEEAPLGVIGSSLLDKLEKNPGHYSFKHHYLLHAADSRILLQLLLAIDGGCRLELTNLRRKSRSKPVCHKVYPMKIYVSTQNGRQYLLCYHYGFRRMMFFRLDYIQTAALLEREPEPEKYEGFYLKFRSHLWGSSTGENFTVDYVEMTLHIEEGEEYILRRLEREKRNGHVVRLDEHRLVYRVLTYDATELLPWIRSFTGRIASLKCSNPQVVRQFYEDLDTLNALYGGGDG